MGSTCQLFYIKVDEMDWKQVSDSKFCMTKIENVRKY